MNRRTFRFTRCIIAIFVLAAVDGSIAALEEVDENDDGRTDQWIEIVDSTTTRVRKDRDFNGTYDYELVYDDRARKIAESLDYNRDGKMDDFYFYVAGVLTRREIDTDFDERIDLWVFLAEGIYISRIERDTDHDGKVDYVMDYGIDSSR